MGNWNDAMKAAEIVMSRDKKNINAIQIKAESLYNSCFFEHALVLFHRGQVIIMSHYPMLDLRFRYQSRTSERSKILEKYRQRQRQQKQ